MQHICEHGPVACACVLGYPVLSSVWCSLWPLKCLCCCFPDPWELARPFCSVVAEELSSEGARTSAAALPSAVLRAVGYRKPHHGVGG